MTKSVVLSSPGEEGSINEMDTDWKNVMASVEVTPVEHSWGMRFDGYMHRI
jgi:hypothetical protein